MRKSIAVVACVLATAGIRAAAQVPALGARYTNALFGYALEYPRGWTIEFFPTEGGARIGPPSTPESTVRIAARAAEAGDGVALDLLAAAYEQSATAELPTDLGRLVDTARRLAPPASPAPTAAPAAPEPAPPADPSRLAIALAGTPALRLTFTSKSHVAVLTVRGGVVYALQLTTSASAFAAYEPYFAGMVRSFRFQSRLNRQPSGP